MIEFRSGTIFLIMVLFEMSSVGCGVKTMPVPPETVIPVPITDLRYDLDEHGATLTWSYPDKLENGKELASIEGFKLSRAVVAKEDYCAGCPLPFSHISIEGGRLTDSEEKRLALYHETELRQGYRYFYKVQSKNGWWSYSHDSNVIFFDWDSPPNKPLNLEVSSQDSRLYLTWKRPETLLDGTVITNNLSYRLYRSENPVAPPATVDDEGFVPLGGLVGKASFVDRDVIDGKSYYYFVRAFRSHGETIQGGPPSDIKNGVPKDLTPPSAPQDVLVVKTVSGITLSWTAVQEKDVAGYRIYRRSPVSPDPILVGEAAVPHTVYIDKESLGDVEIVYFVTAVDYAEPPNESKSSSEVVYK